MESKIVQAQQQYRQDMQAAATTLETARQSHRQQMQTAAEQWVKSEIRTAFPTSCSQQEIDEAVKFLVDASQKEAFRYMRFREAQAKLFAVPAPIECLCKDCMESLWYGQGKNICTR